MYNILTYFEKGQPHVCDYRTHKTARICPKYMYIYIGHIPAFLYIYKLYIIYYIYIVFNSIKSKLSWQ